MLWSLVHLIFKTSSVTPDFLHVFNLILLYLLVSTRAVIGQFSGPLKFKVASVAKLFCDLSPSFLNFHSK